MKRGLQGLVAAGAFGLYGLVGAAAFAQPMQGMGPGMGAGMGPGMAPGTTMGAQRHEQMMEWRAETAAERAARLRALLQLKSSQEAALQTFVGAMDSAHAAMGPPAGAMPATTPERLTRMQQMMAQHQSAMAAMMDATRRFYDQLDPAQKRAFDAMPMMMMHGGQGMMMGQMMMKDRVYTAPAARPPGQPPR